MTAIKRHPLSLRTTKELRQKLEKASAQSGRSLAQEIEVRLEQSFEREELSKALAEEVSERVFVRVGEAVGGWRELFAKRKAADFVLLAPDDPWKRHAAPKKRGDKVVRLKGPK